MKDREIREFFNNIKIEPMVPHEMRGRLPEIIMDVSNILKKLSLKMSEEFEEGISIGEVYQGDLIQIRFVY